MLSSAPTDTADIPIACTLTAEEFATRGNTLTQTLFAHVQETQELPDGYALRFPGDDAWITRLATFITEERRCCPFFTFELRVTPGNGAIWLNLRGPDGVKEMLKDGLLIPV